MSVSSLSIRINDKIWLIVYVRGSKLPKSAQNCQILRYLAIFGVQNDLTGGKFCKKWLLIIKLHGLSSYFDHKKWFQFWLFLLYESFKISNFGQRSIWKWPPMAAGGVADKIFFSEKCSKQYFRKSHEKRWWLKHA